jgi:hypothetical protein
LVLDRARRVQARAWVELVCLDVVVLEAKALEHLALLLADEPLGAAQVSRSPSLIQSQR